MTSVHIVVSGELGGGGSPVSVHASLKGARTAAEQFMASESRAGTWKRKEGTLHWVEEAGGDWVAVQTFKVKP
jgi:hypothetical protein